MMFSVDLIGTVFLGVGVAGVGLDSQEMSWMTLTAQFIWTTSYVSHDGSLRMAGPWCLPHTNRSFSGWVVYWGNQAARW